MIVKILKGLLSMLLIIFVVECSIPPNNLGINHKQLFPCPQTPNCVSSFSQDEVHKIEPLEASGMTKDLKILSQLLSQMPRTTIINQTSNYLHAVVKSPTMGFIDDMEFYLDPENKKIHVRSAARVGFSDTGVNRRRIEAIRKQLQSLPSPK